MIENLKEKRDVVAADLTKQQEEKYKIEQQVAALTERLDAVNSTYRYLSYRIETIADSLEVKASYEKTIAETEAGYMKVCPLSHPQ